MGWHKCVKCGRSDWRYYEHPKGCNFCNIEICLENQKIDEENPDYHLEGIRA